MKKFKNFKSDEELKKWIYESIAECKTSYPLFNGVLLPTAVDIGANVGGFCVHAHKHFEKIYAFEPSTQNCGVALQVFEQLRLNNIQLFNLAVTAHPGRLVKLKHPSHSELFSGNITCLQQIGEGITLQDTGETCETTSLNQIFEKLEIDRIDYLKLDCEGGEYDILEGLQDCDKITFIAMELHNYYGFERKQSLLDELCNHFYLFELWDGRIQFDEKLPSRSINDRIGEFRELDNVFAVNKKYYKHLYYMHLLEKGERI